MSDDLGTVICEIHIRAGDRSPLHLISEDMMAHFEQVEAELEAIRAAEKWQRIANLPCKPLIHKHKRFRLRAPVKFLAYRSKPRLSALS